MADFAHKARQRIIDPLLYRLGYVHYSETILAVTSWTDTEPGTPISGHLMFPGYGSDESAMYVDFAGEIVDPDADLPDRCHCGANADIADMCAACKYSAHETCGCSKFPHITPTTRVDA